MTTIKVPRPPKRAHDPERPMTSLLKAQVEHLHDAERNLPLKYRTKKYVKAIKREGEAAAYIREVTESIHNAHAEVERARGRRLEIAAAAEKPARRSARKTKRKGGNAKRSRK